MATIDKAVNAVSQTFRFTLFQYRSPEIESYIYLVFAACYSSMINIRDVTQGITRIQGLRFKPVQPIYPGVVHIVTTLNTWTVPKTRTAARIGSMITIELQRSFRFAICFFYRVVDYRCVRVVKPTNTG